MKKIVALTVLIAVAVVVFPATAQVRQVADVEMYGKIVSPSGETQSFVVTVGGKPMFAPERWGLATMVGTYQANAVMWTQRPDGSWVAIEYRLPSSPEDYSALREKGIEAITLRRELATADLPPPIRDLLPAIRQNINGFLQFYSGGFRIYLRDQTEEAARLLSRALNAASAAL